MESNVNNVKMIKTDPDTLDVLFKLKGWHLQRGRRVSNSDVIRELILNDAKQKGINNNYQPDEHQTSERENKVSEAK